ncbi:unnamed protein product [Adineta steineri]|uniref:Uncharacterized protein n=1 Tax=Adineta steineri TaxID=433720 RepID=A0A819R1P9_9BILA|nr:unnamed protein product [Adineta steineri]CAF4038350.1 unnamed protein product [Adineta steineri]
MNEIVEAHRFTSLMYCVTRISRQLVRQTYVLPLLMSVLSAIDIRNDLSEIEKEVCRSTGLFEEFIRRFLDEIFEIILSLSTDFTDTLTINEDSIEYTIFQKNSYQS